MTHISVSYPNSKYNPLMEEQMLDRMGEWGVRETDSGICMFAGGTRDLGYRAPSKKVALAAVRSIRATFAAKRIKRATITIS